MAFFAGRFVVCLSEIIDGLVVRRRTEGKRDHKKNKNQTSPFHYLTLLSIDLSALVTERYYLLIITPIILLRMEGLMYFGDRISPTRSSDIQHIEGTYLGYVVVTLKNNRAISRYWTNYSIPAASTI
jgi:hypothetical protein